MTHALPPFSELLDAHAAPLLRYLRTALGPHDAEDCFQETVLAALQAYDGLTHSANLRGWLFVIARRKVLDVHRRRSRAALPTAAPPDAPEPACEPDDGTVWRALARLPRGQHDAVALRVGADLAYADVAEALDCSEAAARQRVRAGLARLRQDPSWQEDG